MNRLLVCLVVSLLLTSVSCGDIFVRGAINTGAQSADGTVSVVQFSAASDGGVSITIITLIGSGMADTLNFCGDQRAQFPVDARVQVSFMPGKTCASVLAVHRM